MTRDVVPQPVESRGFLRRRRCDDPAADQLLTSGPPPAPAVQAPVPTPATVALAGPLAVHQPPPTARPVPTVRAEPDELLRAKDTLLEAALRQNEELSTALLNERHLRQQETDRLTTENDLLRDALAALNAGALSRQQPPEATPPSAPLVQVAEQRAAPPRESQRGQSQVAGQPAAEPDDASRTPRRRSVRRSGPA